MTVPRGLFPIQSEVILATSAIKLEKVPCDLALLANTSSRAKQVKPPSRSAWTDVSLSAQIESQGLRRQEKTG
jgi:hypothetical protein